MGNNRAYNSIKNIVQSGFLLSTMTSGNISNDQFMIWFIQSSNELNNLSKHINPSVYSNYLGLQLLTSNATANQKLNACLIYLIEVMKSL